MKSRTPLTMLVAQRGRRAFTLFEMLVTVSIVAIVAAATLPAFTDDTRLRLMAASAIVASDIELAQTMTISRPEDAAVVKFDADNSSYWIAPAADPDSPITRGDTGQPYVIVLGKERASSADGVSMLLKNMSSSMLEFNAQGGLRSFTNTPIIELRFNTQFVQLSINPTTGSITETFGVIEDDDEDAEVVEAEHGGPGGGAMMAVD